MNAVIEVEALRSKVADAQATVAGLEIDRLTRDEAVERIEAWVDAQRGEIDLGPLLSSAAQGAGSIIDEPLRLHAMGAPDAAHASASLAPFLCQFFADAIKREIIAALDAQADRLCSTTAQKDRRAQLTKARNRLDDLERDEEAAICKAEAEGYPIARRADARPEIILAPVAS